MLRNRTTGVTVIGSNSFMISKDSIKVRESLGVISLNKKTTTLQAESTVSKPLTVSQPLPTEQQSTTIPTSSSIENIEPKNSAINQDTTITEQPLVSDLTDIPQDYPVDLNGFLNGLSEGLSNIVRDVKTSRFAADVKMDATSIWKSTKGAVARLVIEPLRSMDDDDFGADDNSKEAKLARRRKKEYERTEAATKVRMPSAWGESSSSNHHDIVDDDGNTAMNKNKSDNGRRRRSGEMGAKKLAKTPKKVKKSSSTVNDGDNGGSGGGGESAKAELGSAIDLRKLSKAKKVQVFHGPGTAIMVVGARRLVVIEARPTAKEPHQGVVVWMSNLENVASIALEIQPSISNEELSVALKVEVKQGEDHVFVMGVKDSTALVQSIYARLNGEQPPALPKPEPQPSTTSNDEVANEAACLAACSKAEGAGNGSAKNMNPPKTPTAHKSDKRMKSSSKKHHRSHHKKKQDSHNYNTQFPCSTGQGQNGIPLSPEHMKQQQGSPYVSPSTSKGNDMLSPLRIMLSPTGRGKDMSLEITSISSPRGTLSLGPAHPSQHSLQSTSEESPLKSKTICFDQVNDEKATATSENKPLETTTTSESVANVVLEDPMPTKFKLMLKNGVPEQAVKNKMKSELNLKDEEVEAMFVAHQKALDSQPSKTSTSTTMNEDENKKVEEVKSDSSTPLSSEDKSAIAKYKMMLKAGVPEVGVIDKMKKDSIESRLIKVVCSSFEDNNSDKSKSNELSAEEDKQTRKYRVMLKAGVPKDAVRHKMMKDGIDNKRLIKIVLGETDDDNEDEENDNKVEVLTEEEEKKVAKFKAMIKAGVPKMAVKHKMIKELGEKDNQRLIDAVCGYDDIQTGGSEKWKGREKEDKDNVLKTVQKPKNTSKLLTLHWTPLGISEEQLESSVWAQARNEGSGIGYSNGNNKERKKGGGGTVVLSPELQRLELLFSKKQPAKSLPTSSSIDSNENNGQKQKKIKKKASCLDNTRRQNLAIGLRSFKNISPISIGHSLACLDVETFTAEQLTRLEEMLPADTEIKSVENHVKDTEKELKQKLKQNNNNEDNNSEVNDTYQQAIDMLEPAEAFVIGFAKVERAKPKLSILTLMRTLEPQVKELLANFNTLGSACSQASSSPRLTSLLLEVLAVGNIMNEGTDKGGAKGITVDSLLKLTNTRSVCKSMTVLDYIVDSLLVKQSKYMSDKTPSIEDMLDGTPMKKSDSEDDMEEGPASVLTFINELPDLEDACRLPLGELMQQVNQISKSLAMAKREHEKLKTVEEKNAKEQETSSSSRQQKTNPNLSSDDTSSSKTLSLMEMLKQRAGERDEAPVERNSSEGRGVPIGRNLADSMRDEADACQSTKQVSDEQGLRASSFLASDPKACLQAALKARAATEENEEGVNNTSSLLSSSSTTSIALKALDEFIGCAENCLQEVENASIECKLKTENMTKFFGEPGTDAGHILTCLKTFSSMTIESKEKAISKRIEEERRKRIAAKETVTSTPMKGLNSKDNSLNTSRDIDPKAGLMNEIRRNKEARLEKSLRASDSIIE